MKGMEPPSPTRRAPFPKKVLDALSTASSSQCSIGGAHQPLFAFTILNDTYTGAVVSELSGLELDH